MADEAYALGGATSQETYLDIDKIIKVALESGADAVHPGYGFLAENADFARAVIAAGLTWIGPPPEAIEALGDKVRARHIAREAGAPLTPGTPDPVSGADEVLAFAREYGYPVAIKAAFGGGGRGLKVAWREEEVAELYESAVREATAAFGRGECFVERYLDRPRHVETQCLADAHGARGGHLDQGLLAAAQAPEAGRGGAGPVPVRGADRDPVPVLQGRSCARPATWARAPASSWSARTARSASWRSTPGCRSSTRSARRSPASTWCARCSASPTGEPLGYDDPPARGHSIEFRINAEDPGRNFLPAPGTITVWNPPSGPGVRLDAGYAAGMTVPQVFDSLIAKLIVTGASRPQALQRAARALAEFEVGGMPTVLPFHRAVVADPAFTGRRRCGCTPAGSRPSSPRRCRPRSRPRRPSRPERERSRSRWAASGSRWWCPPPRRVAAGYPPVRRPNGPGRAPGQPALGAPGGERRYAGQPHAGHDRQDRGRRTGQRVSAGDVVVVLEAMKMEQPLTAHKDGTVTGLAVEVGQTVTAGAAICELTD